jgi:hypothetical protein
LFSSFDSPTDTVGDLKKLVAAQAGTNWEKIVLKKWYALFLPLYFGIFPLCITAMITIANETLSYFVV